MKAPRPPVLLTLALTALVIGATGCASHHSAMGAGPVAATQAQLSATDLAFAHTAAGIGMYEVEASRLAAGKATHVQVKNYANMLVNHHTLSNNELIAVLRAKGVTPPAALPADKRAKVAQLSSLSGDAFDRQYIGMTGVADHQAAITTFEQASRTLSDPDLKAWTVKNLPTLRQHLQSAQGIMGTLAG